MADTVKLTEEDIKQYLDSCITHWRERKKNATVLSDIDMAVHYIDAYQSVRISLFDELFPVE